MDCGLRIEDCGFAPGRPTGIEGGEGESAIRNPQSAMAGGEGGYTLVVFVMIIAVMAIMMGVAVQSVSFAMQREREAELIFRGQQYVEAIRLYRLKYGRYPMRLKEIWEADPRVIRQAWKDPITDSDKWGLVFLGQDGQPIGGQSQGRGASGSAQGGRRGGAGGRTGRGGSQMEATPGPLPGDVGGGSGFGGRSREQQGEKVGPIVGVHTTDCRDSIKVYEGRTRLCDWKFVFREQQRQGQGGRQPGGNPPQPTKNPEDELPFHTQPRDPQGTPRP
jgi:type II secretory pathway pseudopilin PulG